MILFTVITLFTLAGLTVAGSLWSITQVGKPRPPRTAGEAAFTVGFSAITVTALIFAALELLK